MNLCTRGWRYPSQCRCEPRTGTPVNPRGVSAGFGELPMNLRGGLQDLGSPSLGHSRVPNTRILTSHPHPFLSVPKLGRQDCKVQQVPTSWPKPIRRRPGRHRKPGCPEAGLRLRTSSSVAASRKRQCARPGSALAQRLARRPAPAGGVLRHGDPRGRPPGHAGAE